MDGEFACECGFVLTGPIKKTSNIQSAVLSFRENEYNDFKADELAKDVSVALLQSGARGRC